MHPLLTSKSRGTPRRVLRVLLAAAASSAQTRGGGYEPQDRYAQCRILFARLESGPTLRDFLERALVSVRHREQPMSSWLADSGPWLTQVQLCLLYASCGSRGREAEKAGGGGGGRVPLSPLARVSLADPSSSLCVRACVRAACGPSSRAAATIAQQALRGSSFLVHCEDDADTVPILTALTKLCLDPFYRTYKGFQHLIEEDWLAFGYRFSDRCGHQVCSALAVGLCWGACPACIDGRLATTPARASRLRHRWASLRSTAGSCSTRTLHSLSTRCSRCTTSTRRRSSSRRPTSTAFLSTLPPASLVRAAP